MHRLAIILVVGGVLVFCAIGISAASNDDLLKDEKHLLAQASQTDTGGVISCPTIYGGPACTLVELKAARQSLARLEVFEKPLPKLEIVPDAAPGDDEEENNN